MVSSARPTTLPVNNDLDIRVVGAAVREVQSDVLSFRGYIADEREDPAPLHADLAAPATAQGPAPSGNASGDYIATIPGATLAARLIPAYRHRQVWIIAESVPPGSYRDGFPVTVVSDQSG